MITSKVIPLFSVWHLGKYLSQCIWQKYYLILFNGLFFHFYPSDKKYKKLKLFIIGNYLNLFQISYLSENDKFKELSKLNELKQQNIVRNIKLLGDFLIPLNKNIYVNLKEEN